MRKKIIVFTILIIVAMCAYPPWLLFKNTQSSDGGVIRKLPIPSKYSFIWESPEEGGYSESISATIDIRRLIVQCFIVLVVGGCLTFICQRKDELIADKQNSDQEMVIINKNLVEKTVENTYTKTEKIPIICPQCHKRLFGATRDMVGETGICPKCKAEFIIEDKHMQDIFSGRYNRAKYIMMTLLVALPLAVMAFFISESEFAVSEKNILYFLINLIAFIALMPIAIKRLHDLNMSGMCYMIFLAPVANFILGLYLLFKEGTPGPNKYGPLP